MSKVTLSNVTSGFASTSLLNANSTALTNAIENTLSRDGTGPNQMLAPLDMNGNLIINQANPITVSGFNWEGSWLTGTTYHVGDVVENSNSSYICIVEHIANVFATDLAGGKWQIVASSASLPAQSGNNGKLLTTDGSNASWAGVSTFALPISGGTLTGSLNGTDIFVSGNIQSVTATFTTGITGGTSSFSSGTYSGTLTVNSIIIPNSLAGIQGTTTNDSANAGSIGEYKSLSVPVGSAVALVTGVSKNVTSITLTPGDWDVNGLVNFRTTTTTNIFSLFMTSSLVSDTVDSYQTSYRISPFVPGIATDIGFPIPIRRISISANTTVYLVATAGFSASTLSAWGFISARRVR